VKTSKDERDFRPSSLKEIQQAKGYVPFKVIYTHSDGRKIDYNVGCWLSCEDLGIICSLFIVLWMALLGIYGLLLKAALDTDEKSTALWIFFAFGFIFGVFVAGAVAMHSVETALHLKYNPVQEVGMKE